jgi:hypothetical protein
VKDRGHRLARRVATGFLTGSAGRFTAFVLDVTIATTRYWRGRRAGEEES